MLCTISDIRGRSASRFLNNLSTADTLLQPGEIEIPPGGIAGSASGIAGSAR